MSSGLTETITIQANKATASNWQMQLLKISMRLRLIQKYASDKINQIHAKFQPQKDEIRSKIASLDTEHTAREYQELMTELNNLENQEETEVKKVEGEQSDQESAIQLEQDGLQTRLEALQKDTETLESTRESNISRSFGYFNAGGKK